mgnify:CR=1 FL=1
MNEREIEFQRLRAIIEATNREIIDFEVKLVLAQRDELTGLPRRTELTEKAQRSINNRQLPLSLIFADLNGFKKINDTIGHAAGDSLIIQFGEFLKKQKRFFGEGSVLVTLSRFGGDEFVILLPYTNNKEATEFISIVKTNLLNEIFTISEKHSFTVRVAMGLATTGANCSTVAALLHHADQAMYKDKARMKKAREITKRTVFK